MEICNFLLTLLITLISIYLLIVLRKIAQEKRNKFPPGPRGYIPLLGGVLKAGKQPYKYFNEMRKKYGNILAFDMGPKRIVVMHDYKLIKEALAMPEFNGSRITECTLIRMDNRLGDHERHGILFNDGKVWSDQRRFTLKSLRSFGFGVKSTIQNLLELETVDLIDTFKKTENKPTTISHQFNGAVINSLWSILTGNRREQNDPIMIDLYQKLTEDVPVMLTLLFFPWLFKLDKWIPLDFITKYRKNCQFELNFMKSEVQRHKLDWEENYERDFIDIYLTKIHQEKNVSSSFFKDQGEMNLTTILNDIFVAGSESSSTSLNWTVHLLATYPEIQEKTFEEIKNVTGLTRYATLADRPLLPLTEALILEIQRYASLVPLIGHEVTADLTFHGYNFPKGTFVLFNLYSCLWDEEIWGDPWNFRPTRFIEDNVLKKPPGAFIPFSHGVRVCIGESLAKDELFLFTTALIQRFKISPESKCRQAKVETHYQGTNCPVPFPLVFQDRFE